MLFKKYTPIIVASVGSIIHLHIIRPLYPFIILQMFVKDKLEKELTLQGC
jgi:hypothetical protein